MSDFIEITEIDLDPQNVSMSNAESKYGGGIELLMNENTSEKLGNPESIQLDDLERLESELNEIVDVGGSVSKKDIFTDNIQELKLNTEDLDMSQEPDSVFEKPSVSFQDDAGPSFGNFGGLGSIGKETSKNSADNATWDGFNKFNEIPVTPDIEKSPEPKQTKEELLREKFQLLRKLEALETKGVQLSKKYTMDSPILEMKGEYETILDEKAKSNSIKFQGNMLMTFINGLEFLNNRFDPFDLKLDGWSEQIGDNIDDYDDVFGELYDKYKTKASMAPELKMLFQLGGSAAMLHMTNTMFKSAMPGMDDILRQNPDLAKQFQKAAVDSMSTSSPGFSGFMGNLGGMGSSPSPGGGGPPPPVPTQGPYAQAPPDTRPGNSTSFDSRPDLNNMGGSMSDGINISENFSSAMAGEKSMREDAPRRPEMKGPKDIDNLLSGFGLKTKKVNMSGSSDSPSSGIDIQDTPVETSFATNESSTISISDLKEMQSSSMKTPKKSKRRSSDKNKNTVSLDI